MGFDAWITLGTAAVVLLTLVCTSQPPDLIMIGALTLSILDNILGLRNVQSEYQAILKGVIIVLAVVIQRQRR